MTLCPVTSEPAPMMQSWLMRAPLSTIAPMPIDRRRYLEKFDGIYSKEPTDRIINVLGYPICELAEVAEKVAALRAELGRLPTKAELAALSEKVAALPDPVGEVLRMWRRPNGSGNTTPMEPPTSRMSLENPR